MRKVMCYIDGSWLYQSLFELTPPEDQAFRVDFGVLPQVLLEQLSEQSAGQQLDLVRVLYFASYPVNVDGRDLETAQRQQNFYRMLHEEFRYELELYPIDFRGRRLRRADRDRDDDFRPREKCVDIALAASLLYYAAIPGAYDIALVLTGDRDFKPVFRAVRLLGKRTALASIRASCSGVFTDPREESQLLDFKLIWLEALRDKIELQSSPRRLRCTWTEHEGDPWVEESPAPGLRGGFICSACRSRIARLREEAAAAGSTPATDAAAASDGGIIGADENQALLELESLDRSSTESGPLETAESVPEYDESLFEQDHFGSIYSLKSDRGYGFIRTAGLGEFFFHATDLARDISLADLKPGIRVRFRITGLPSASRAGAASEVCPLVRRSRDARHRNGFHSSSRPAKSSTDRG